ncbi:glycosyltransferase family 2 protein [Cryobacterium sp. 1639]|uniref:glycosyltransferase family 2 protein n=1 Tax=Cryobacterium inferilacus TaxID=2866629 RepID=UPI001C732578|nr:glycosyltransferase family 2 protein [Cryobacterium sp. 1639]MBX0299472.1 glycosyltransferase family 2 protein [Cryobacterium sp. 1639]
MTDRVTIAVLTYQRPRDLAELLPALVRQAEEVDAAVDILIVDNDPAAGAREQVLRAGADAPIRYRHEPAPGIAAARNRALDECTARWLIFIDDDERPTPEWLTALLAAQASHRAVAVVGPVVSRYDITPSRWVEAGRFFERRRMATGTPVTVAATNNLLLDLHWVRRNGLRFDTRFGLTGGSDSLFTRQLHERGGRMVWCDEAVVIDVVPAKRLTREWVLRRAYRIGNASSRVRLNGRTGGQRQLLRLGFAAGGALRVIAGSLRALAGLLTGRLGHRARGTRTAARGAGMLSGALGSVYSEYSRS